MKNLRRVAVLAIAMVAMLFVTGCTADWVSAPLSNKEVGEAKSTAMVEPTQEPTNTPEPTVTLVPTEEPTETVTVEPTQTTEPTNTPEPTATSVPTKEPTATAEPTLEPTVEPTQTTEPTETPIPTNTPEPTATEEQVIEPQSDQSAESVNDFWLIDQFSGQGATGSLFLTKKPTTEDEIVQRSEYPSDEQGFLSLPIMPAGTYFGYFQSENIDQYRSIMPLFEVADDGKLIRYDPNGCAGQYALESNQFGLWPKNQALPLVSEICTYMVWDYQQPSNLLGQAVASPLEAAWILVANGMADSSAQVNCALIFGSEGGFVQDRAGLWSDFYQTGSFPEQEYYDCTTVDGSNFRGVNTNRVLVQVKCGNIVAPEMPDIEIPKCEKAICSTPTPPPGCEENPSKCPTPVPTQTPVPGQTPTPGSTPEPTITPPANPTPTTVVPTKTPQPTKTPPPPTKTPQPTQPPVCCPDPTRAAPTYPPVIPTVIPTNPPAPTEDSGCGGPCDDVEEPFEVSTYEPVNEDPFGGG